MFYLGGRRSAFTLGGTTRMSHEEAFVRAFIVPDKQARYLDQFVLFGRLFQ